MKALAVRPIEETDVDRLVAFHHTLSPETQYLRFFSPHPELLPRELHRFTHVDGVDRLALVVMEGERIVAVGRYDRCHDDSAAADVAFVVADELQGNGIGHQLFERLTVAARANGVRRFVADTLAHNRRMLSVFHHAGYPVRTFFDGTVVHLEIDISRTPSSRPE